MSALNLNSFNSQNPLIIHQEKVRTLLNTLAQIEYESAKAFETVTSRLSSQARSELAAKLDRLPDQDNLLKKVYEIVTQGDFKNDFIREKNFDLYALQAVNKGILSLEQFCSQMILKASFEEKNITLDDFECVSLFTDSSINPKAWDILVDTNKLKNERFKGKTYITLQELDEVLKIMQQANVPESERKFYLIPDKKEFKIPINFLSQFLANILREPPQFTIEDAVQKQAHFSFLMTCTYNSKNYRIIPSFTLRQTILNHHYGSDAIEMLPVISESTAEDLRDAELLDKRDFAIPFSEYRYPTEADSYPASKLNFINHEWYHLWVASATPQQFRKLLLRLSYPFSETNTQSKHPTIIKKIKEKFIDLENAVYRAELYEKPLSNQEKIYAFWKTIAINLSSTAAISSDFIQSFEYKKTIEFISQNYQLFFNNQSNIKSLEKLLKEEIDSEPYSFFSFLAMNSNIVNQNLYRDLINVFKVKR